MLTRVQIKNFKSIGEGPGGGPGVDIELKPLTFLVGPNGGGKSSILEAIAFASQGFARGELLQETRDLDLVHRSKDDDRLSSQWRIDIRAWFDDIGGVKNIGRGIGNFEFFGSDDRQPISDEIRMLLSTYLESLKNSAYLLRSTRGFIRYNDGPYASRWVEPQGERILGVMNQINATRFRKVRDEVDRWSKVFEIKNPGSALAGSNMIEGTGQDTCLDIEVNLSQTSSGGRQALVILLQVIFSPENSLTLVEEPEISLHPQAQLEMIRFLAEHAAKGKQIIATTHSPFMVMALRRVVREGTLPADKMAVYHVERNKDSKRGEAGATVANPLPLTQQGYIEGWIPSFSDVERDLLKDWASVFEGKQNEKKPAKTRNRAK